MHNTVYGQFIFDNIKVIVKYFNNNQMVGFPYTVQQTLISSSKIDKTWLNQCSGDPLIYLNRTLLVKMEAHKKEIKLYWLTLLLSVFKNDVHVSIVNEALGSP